MSTALNFTQHLQTIVLAGGITLLSLFFLMSIRAKIRRRSGSEHPREFIRRARESAAGTGSSNRLVALGGGGGGGVVGSAPAFVTGGGSGSGASGSVGRRPLTSTAEPTTLGVVAEPKEGPPGRGIEEIVELEATVRRLTAHLGTRTEVLSKLIRDADQRIEEIRAVIDQIPGASISPAKVERLEEVDDQREVEQLESAAGRRLPELIIPRFPKSPLSGIPRTPIAEGVRKGAEAEEDLPEVGVVKVATSAVAVRGGASSEMASSAMLVDRVLQAAASGSAEESKVEDLELGGDEIAALRAVDDELDPLTINVYELSDRGFSSVSIAQDLDEHVGKVELILALRSSG